jgi:hypothetical protein
MLCEYDYVCVLLCTWSMMIGLCIAEKLWFGPLFPSLLTQLPTTLFKIWLYECMTEWLENFSNHLYAMNYSSPIQLKILFITSPLHSRQTDDRFKRKFKKELETVMFTNPLITLNFILPRFWTYDVSDYTSIFIKRYIFLVAVIGIDFMPSWLLCLLI